MRPRRLIRCGIVLKPSTLLALHRALIRRKYRRLFSSTVPRTPGPKGPTEEIIAAVVEMKRRNPSWGCPRIAQQIALAFAIPISKDTVRRILAVRCQLTPQAFTFGVNSPRKCLRTLSTPATSVYTHCFSASSVCVHCQLPPQVFTYVINSAAC